MLRTLLVVLVVFALVLCAGHYRTTVADSVLSAVRSTYLLKTSVMSSGGSPGSSTLSHGDGTLGQPTAVGMGASGGKVLHGGFWALSRGALSGFDGGPTQVWQDMLFQNFPNPFTVSTTVEYTLSRQGRVQVSVYDVMGREVKTLMDGSESPGRHGAVWDGCDESGDEVSAGIYFCHIEAGTYRDVKKMVVSR